MKYFLACALAKSGVTESLNFYRIPGLPSQFNVCFCLFFFQSHSRIDLSSADESRMTAVQVGTVRWHNHLAHEGESVVTKFFLGQLRYYVRRTVKVITYQVVDWLLFLLNLE